MMNLEFRRQFIMGNRIVMEDWVQTIVNDRYFLSTHEDLQVNQILENGKELTLIGYIVNPHEPDHTNIDCLKAIFNNVNSQKDIVEELYIYAGRFVLIGVIDGEMLIITDPCSLRQVYYTALDGHLWFSSQPNLLANYFNIPIRQDAKLLEFINSQAYEDFQRFWVGDDCIYENVRHLMPNHYFSIGNKEAIRYWVNHEKSITIDESVNKASEILKGSMDAIANRGRLIQGLTAGWDSRMLLAASKDIKNNIQFWTLLVHNSKTKSIDLKIAEKLAEKLNLNLLVIYNLIDLREEIDIAIKKNVTQGETHTTGATRTVQFYYDNFQECINVYGNCSEIARNYYGSDHPSVITPEYLVKKTGYYDIEFVKDNIEKWMEGVPEHVLDDIDFPDLLYWEQRMGNWAAMRKAQADVAIEDYSPFDNRELLMTLYNVDKNYRSYDSSTLYKEIMKKLWPEVLSEPVNPPAFKDKVKKAIKKLLPRSIIDLGIEIKHKIKYK